MNKILGLTQGAREELCNIEFPMCVCRLTLAWISSENSTTHEECWLNLIALPSLTLGPYLMPTAHFCCPVSTGHSCHPSPTAFSEFLCPTPTRVPLPTSSHVEIAKTDKGIVCFADHLHSVTGWPGFNPSSSHARDSKNGTWCFLA